MINAGALGQTASPSSSLSSRLAALVIFLFVLVSAWRYPVAPVWLTLGLAGFFALQFYRPLSWLFVLPAAIPLLDLAAWSGRVYLEDYDLLVLSAAAACMWRGRYSLPSRLNRRPGFWLIIGLLAIAHVIGLSVSLWPPPPLDLNAFASYLSPYNALRQLKPFAESLLLLPALAFALRNAPEAAGRHFAWGAAAGAAMLGLVALWERGVLATLAGGAGGFAVLGSLLDYTGIYRITGLFHDMHTGGEAVDAFLALTWPAALWLMFAARGWAGMGGAALALLLGAYAVTVTFSRASYIALFAGLLAMAVVAVWMRAGRHRPAQPRATSRWVALASPVALALSLLALALAFREGGIVALAGGVIGLVLAMGLGFFRARLGGRPATAGTIALALAVLAVAARGLATSQWVEHDLAQSLLLGAVIAMASVLPGLLLGATLVGRVNARELVALLMLLSIAIGAIFPALLGYRMSERTARVEADREMRAEHWDRALKLLGDSPIDYLLGKGLGSFPSEYLWRYGQGASGIYSLGAERDNAYLTLGIGGDLILGQRLGLEAGREYVLSLRWRGHDRSASLGMRLCRRNILQYSEWNPTCVDVPGVRAEAPGTWRSNEFRLRLPAPAAGAADWLRPPFVLEIRNRTAFSPGLDGRVDIDDLRLVDADGGERLSNGGFEAGMDYWLPYYDFEHLAWHVKNIWVHVAFELGVFGLLAMLALWLYALARALALLRAGQPQAVYFAGALAATLAVGVFGAILDVPRVALLLFLTLYATSLTSRARPRKSATAPAATARTDPRPPPPADGAATPGAKPDRQANWSWLTWGVGLTLLVAGGGYLASRHFGLEPRLLLAKTADRLGLGSDWIQARVAGVPNYRDHVLDGRIRASHPRILLPELAGWDGAAPHPLLARRLAADPGLAAGDCSGDDVLWLASCWLRTADPALHARLIRALRDFRPSAASVEADSVGNGWQLALAYDLARASSGMGEGDRQLIEAGIEQALGGYLRLLDGPGPSLWHGRAALAASAWLCAVALDSGGVRDSRPVARAQGHFLDVMRALALTEAWPEGYNYWINSRAFVLGLAASAYLNGLQGATRADEIRRTMARVGLWHIHATRPDNRIEALGDEGPRVDLKDESQRVIDLIAGLTGGPVLPTFSRYIEGLHGAQGYYPDYRWAKPLLQDPGRPFLSMPEPGSLMGLESALPKAERFGPRAMDQAYIRSGWNRDATFISYRAGKSLTHHGQYDAGHFTLFKGAPLAVKSGVYSGVPSAHRLNYAIRTVAHNSLLIMRPGELVKPNHLFSRNVSDGGQRLVMPTGSDVHSTRQWRENAQAGGRYGGAEMTAFEHRPGVYTYVDSDLAPAYNTPDHDSGGTGGKVERARRELLYLEREDRLIVHDDVVSTRPEYVKKWLLHSMTRPQVEAAVVLRGQAEDGILESASGTVYVSNGRGRLVVQRLLPEAGATRLVGGEKHRFYVEADGDDSDLDGFNADEGVEEIQPWFDAGLWRIEFQPTRPARRNHFLVVLSPSLDRYRADLATPLRLDAGHGLALPGALVVFADAAAKRLAFPRMGGQEALYLLGLPPFTPVRMSVDGRQLPGQRSNASGVLVAALPAGVGGGVEIGW